MDRFDKIFNFTLSVEGGYTNDKNDKGGELGELQKRKQERMAIVVL